MTGTIAAIPTSYGGRFYRSRIEARWAVFFDAIGIRFDYEAEGFVIREGGYLPDFRLPDLRFYFEVKGQDPTDEERSKCAQVCMASEYDMLLAVGGPEERFQLYWFDREGERDAQYVLAQDENADCGFWLISDDGHANYIGPPSRTGALPRRPLFSGALEEAYALAGSADFTAPRRRKHSRVERLHHAPTRRTPYFRDEETA
jgi:hypothetical protein